MVTGWPPASPALIGLLTAGKPAIPQIQQAADNQEIKQSDGGTAPAAGGYAAGTGMSGTTKEHIADHTAHKTTGQTAARTPPNPPPAGWGLGGGMPRPGRGCAVQEPLIRMTEAFAAGRGMVAVGKGRSGGGHGMGATGTHGTAAAGPGFGQINGGSQPQKVHRRPTAGQKFYFFSFAAPLNTPTAPRKDEEADFTAS